MLCRKDGTRTSRSSHKWIVVEDDLTIQVQAEDRALNEESVLKAWRPRNDPGSGAIHYWRGLEAHFFASEKDLAEVPLCCRVAYGTFTAFFELEDVDISSGEQRFADLRPDFGLNTKQGENNSLEFGAACD